MKRTRSPPLCPEVVPLFAVAGAAHRLSKLDKELQPSRSLPPAANASRSTSITSNSSGANSTVLNATNATAAKKTQEDIYQLLRPLRQLAVELANGRFMVKKQVAGVNPFEYIGSATLMGLGFLGAAW